jgi:hypothetical protein
MGGAGRQMKTCSVRQIGRTADLDDAQRRPQGEGHGWPESILSDSPLRAGSVVYGCSVRPAIS